MFLTKSSYDIVCLSEHWVLSEEVLKNINLGGYILADSFCRTNNIHGGVAIYVKNNIKFKKLVTDDFNAELNSEFCAIDLIERKIVIITVYRPCNVMSNKNFDTFLTNLENMLLRYCNTNSQIVLVGDFNVDFRGHSTELTDLISLIDSFGLHVTISDYTRISKNSSTCIDNIITNFDCENYEVGVIEPCLSDHLGQFLNLKVTINTAQRIYKRHYTKNSVNKLCNSLKEIEWRLLYDNESININLTSNYLCTTYSNLIKKHFPLKRIINSNKKSPVSWFNNNLRTLRETLTSVKTICNVTKKESDYRVYNNLRKNYKCALSEAKKLSYQNYITNSDNKAKASWNIINFERNKVAKQQIAPTISENDFNIFFTGIADNINKSLKPANISIDDIITNIPSPPCSFYMEPVTEAEVLEAVKSLKDSPCTDVFELNSKIIKETIEIILPFFTVLINACFSIGIFPDCFKLAKVIPIFKKGDPNIADNYRPISIIPIFGKIMEIILKKRLYRYLELNSILCACQFGFRAGCSTARALHKVVQDVVKGFEMGEHTAVALCDLTKAFDCVPHDLLLIKLERYGIRGLPLLFFKSYLENRSQCVIINDKMSDFRINIHGVPQGSVIGPVLFLMFINDINYFVSPNKCVLFADDTTLIISHKNFSQLDSLLAALEKQVESWFNANKLKINNNKTQKLFVSSNHIYTEGNNVKLLGVILDDNLSWSGHVEYLSKSLPSTIFLIRQLNSVVDQNTLVSTYFALFHSHISYAVFLWGNSGHAFKIFRLQKRAIRAIAKIGGKEHCRPFFIKFGILPLPSIYVYSTVLEIHSNIKNFCFQSDVHGYNTRSANMVRQERFKLSKSKSNTLNVNLYNKIPPRIRQLNYTRLKSAVKSHLLKHCFYSVQEFLETPFP